MQDYRERVAGVGWPPYEVTEGGEVLLIHPLADEHDVLQQLKMTPENCVAVDGYWAVRGDVVFLQVNGRVFDDCNEPGLYARIAGSQLGHVNLVAVVEEKFVTSDVLNRVTREFLSRGWERSKLGEKLELLR
jgi:hypothetical protein